MKRPYEELSKQFVLLDNLDDWDDPEILVGVSIAAEDAKAFIRDVEELAVKKYGGATFEELFDADTEDESMDAARQQHLKDLFASVVKTAERILKNARPGDYS